jgi:hypothetical protein
MFGHSRRTRSHFPNDIKLMQIAGSTCEICGQHVVFAREGKLCSSCRIVVHRECDAKSTCTRCGREYKLAKPPIADPARDTIVPRSLRPNRSASPVAMVLLAALLVLFGFAFLLLLVHH